MPPVWSGRKCFIVSIDQLVAWHKLKKSSGEIVVLSQDPKTRGLRVLADQVEVVVLNSGRVDSLPETGAQK
jgi:hypothetical protein